MRNHQNGYIIIYTSKLTLFVEAAPKATRRLLEDCAADRLRDRRFAPVTAMMAVLGGGDLGDLEQMMLQHGNKPLYLKFLFPAHVLLLQLWHACATTGACKVGHGIQACEFWGEHLHNRLGDNVS